MSATRRTISHEVGTIPGADDTPKSATEQARLRMLARVPPGYAVEYDPDAPPVAAPGEGLPEGPTGRTMRIAEWAAKKGITPDQGEAATAGPSMQRSRATRPPRRLDAVTEISIAFPEKTIKATGRGGKVYTINLIEPALQDGAVLTWTEMQIEKLSGSIREVETREAAQEIGALLYQRQMELLDLLLPDTREGENAEMIRALGPTGFRNMIDVAKRFVYEVFTDPDVIAQAEAEHEAYEHAQATGAPAPN